MQMYSNSIHTFPFCLICYVHLQANILINPQNLYSIDRNEVLKLLVQII